MADDGEARVSFQHDEQDAAQQPQPQAAVAMLGAALDRSNALLERATKTMDDLLARPMPEQPACMRDLKRDPAADSADRPPDEAVPEPEGQGDAPAAAGS